MAEKDLEAFVMNNHFLFTSKTIIKDTYRKYIRCEDCIYSIPHDDKFVGCKVYPNMLSRKDKTCKSAKEK